MTPRSSAPPRAVPLPLAPDSPYAPPRAAISPDRSQGWLRRALPLVLSHRALFAAALGTAFLSLVLSLRLPKVLDNAVDEALVAREAPLSRFVWQAAVLAVGTGITSLLARQLLMRVAYALEYDLRNLVYEHLTRLSAAFYDRQQSGQLISRANSDVRAVQMFLAFAPFVIVQCLGAVIAFGFMVSIDPVLAAATMATLPLVAWAATRMQRALLPASWLIQSRLAEVTTIVDESVNGVRVVKSFAAEDREVRAMTRAAHRLQWAYVKDADLRARYAPVVQNVSQLGMVVLLLLGGYRVVSGDLEVGAMLAFSAYVALLQGPFQMLGNLVMMSQRAAASASRVYELLDERPAVADRAEAHELGVHDGEVRFEDVTFGYQPGRPVLQGFSLALTRGETVALVGRTGSGKSTVARLLTRAYDVDSGRITIDGDDIRDVTQRSLRSTVGVVQEEPFLFSCSIRDNIAYGRPDAAPQQIEAAAEAAGAAEFVRRLPEGYDTLVGERGYTLSGGQRQRIALARALLADPPILVLDDATSSLDVEVEAQVHRSLTATLPDRTVLVVAHRLSTISTADRVVVLEGGRVVADGSHADLLVTSPVYKEVLAQVHAHEPLEADPPIDLEPELAVDLEMGLRP